VTATPQQQATLAICAALADAIRDLSATSPLRGVPAGELYARVMGHVSLETFESIVGVLVRAGLVSRTNHLLAWVGPRS
jgi:hypothetical protein